MNRGCSPISASSFVTTLEPDGTAAACKAASKWVRLPPASLDCSTAGSDFICTRGKWSEPNLRRVVLKAAQLNVGTTSTPCNGVPKGTMSRQTFVGLFKTHWRLPVGVHRSSSATGDHESGRWVGFPHGASGHHIVALKIGPTAELEYMVHNPGVVGSSPTGAAWMHGEARRQDRSAVAQWQSTVRLWFTNFVGLFNTRSDCRLDYITVRGCGFESHQRRFLKDGAVAEWQTRVVWLNPRRNFESKHSTAGVEYMDKQVRLPPGPLILLWGRTR